MTVYLTNLHQTQDKKEAFTCNKQDQSPILKCYWPLLNISSTGNSGWRPVIPSYLQFSSYYWPRYMSLLHYVKPRSVSRTSIARVLVWTMRYAHHLTLRFSTLCKVERLAMDTGLQGTKCNQDIGLSHCFILNRFFHSLYVRCDVAIIFYTIKDHRHDVWFFFRFYPFFLTLSVKTLFFRIKQINCKSTRLLRCYRY